MWDALHEVSAARGQTIHQYCSEIQAQRRESSLTAAIRMALLDHYRQGASDKTGHNGRGEPPHGSSGNGG